MREVVVGALVGVAAVGCGTDTHTVTITFAGDGAGWVETGTMRCTSSCTIDNAPRVVSLLAGTPSTFGGWSGACGSAGECNPVVDKDLELTVTFNRDPGELATLFPTSDVTAIAFAGDDLVIASDTDLRRVALDGTVRWSVPATHPTTIVVGPAGDVYTIEQGMVVVRQGDGSPRAHSVAATALAVAANGDVIAMLPDHVERVSAGTTVWTADVSQAVSVAIDSTGMTAVATVDGKVLRLDASGARLTPDWSVPWPLPSSIAFDAQDFLVAQLVDPNRPDWSGNGFCAPGGRTLTRLDRTGTVMFRVDEDCIEGLPAGLLPNGTDLFSFQPSAYQTDPHITPYFKAGGLALRTYGLDGAQGAWSLSKNIVGGYGGPPYTDAVTGTMAGCDRGGRCAVAGTYALGADPRWPVVTSPWIEVLSVP